MYSACDSLKSLVSLAFKSCSYAHKFVFVINSSVTNDTVIYIYTVSQ